MRMQYMVGAEAFFFRGGVVAIDLLRCRGNNSHSQIESQQTDKESRTAKTCNTARPTNNFGERASLRRRLKAVRINLRSTCFRLRAPPAHIIYPYLPIYTAWPRRNPIGSPSRTDRINHLFLCCTFPPYLNIRLCRSPVSSVRAGERERKTSRLHLGVVADAHARHGMDGADAKTTWRRTEPGKRRWKGHGQWSKIHSLHA